MNHCILWIVKASAWAYLPVQMGARQRTWWISGSGQPTGENFLRQTGTFVHNTSSSILITCSFFYELPKSVPLLHSVGAGDNDVCVSAHRYTGESQCMIMCVFIGGSECVWMRKRCGTKRVFVGKDLFV